MYRFTLIILLFLLYGCTDGSYKNIDDQVRFITGKEGKNVISYNIFIQKNINKNNFNVVIYNNNGNGLDYYEYEYDKYQNAEKDTSFYGSPENMPFNLGNPLLSKYNFKELTEKIALLVDIELGDIYLTIFGVNESRLYIRVSGKNEKCYYMNEKEEISVIKGCDPRG